MLWDDSLEGNFAMHWEKDIWWCSTWSLVAVGPLGRKARECHQMPWKCLPSWRLKHVALLPVLLSTYCSAALLPSACITLWAARVRAVNGESKNTKEHSAAASVSKSSLVLRDFVFGLSASDAERLNSSCLWLILPRTEDTSEYVEPTDRRTSSLWEAPLGRRTYVGFWLFDYEPNHWRIMNS